MTPSLLDTHAWVWLAAGHRRLQRYEPMLLKAAEARALLLPAVAVYEAMTIGFESETGKRRGKQAVVMKPTVSQWIRDALLATRVTPVALDATMAQDAATFRAMHADPFDRLIVATALRTGARLLTADEKMLAFAAAAGIEHVAL